MEFNCVHTNYFSKTVIFPEMGGEWELMFVSAKQEEEFLKEEAQVFSIFYSLGIDSKATTGELSIVCDFPEVFSVDINGLSPE